MNIWADVIMYIHVRTCTCWTSPIVEQYFQPLGVSMGLVHVCGLLNIVNAFKNLIPLSQLLLVMLISLVPDLVAQISEQQIKLFKRCYQ